MNEWKRVVEKVKTLGVETVEEEEEKEICIAGYPALRKVCVATYF